MWTAISRGGLALVVLTFMMWLLRRMLDLVVPIAMSGPNSDAESVQQIGGYFSAMTTDNLVLLGAVAVGLYLFGRAAAERRLG